VSSTLLTELRRKFPGRDGRRKALRKLLGSDELVDQLLRKPAATGPKRSLAYDASVDRHDDRSVESERKKSRLEEILLNAGLNTAELDEARELLSGLHMPDIFSVEDEEFELSENPTSLKGNPDIDSRLDKIRRLLHEAKLGDEDIEEALDIARRGLEADARDHWDLPRNATRAGMGGRFSEAGAADRKRIARDARASFKQRFPEIASARLTGTPLEAGICAGEDLARVHRRRIATDEASAAKAAKGFFDRYPGAARIG